MARIRAVLRHVRPGVPPPSAARRRLLALVSDHGRALATRWQSSWHGHGGDPPPLRSGDAISGSLSRADDWIALPSTGRVGRFETLVDSALSLGDFLIFFAIAILPWAVMVGLVAYGVVRFVLWRVRASRERRPAGG